MKQQNPRAKTPAEVRFWRFVAQTGNVCECWIWLGHIDKDGYGDFGIIGHGAGHHARAHRYAYEITIGSIPSGLTIDHLCRVRDCCNPYHLEPVSTRENTMRGTSFSAVNNKATHCKNGHEFTPDNTYLRKRPGGGRICKTCIFARTYAARAKKRCASS